MATLGTRLLTISVGGTDYTAQATDVRISSGAADNDAPTFAEAAAGGSREYTLKFTALQDPATGTLWDKVWASAGTTAAIIVKPAGGSATPSATQPHFTGNVIITEPDGDLLGGEADAGTGRWTFEAEWKFTAKPTRLTA